MRQGNGQVANWTGGKDSMGTSGINMASPGTDGTAESPGQWIAQVGAGGQDGNGGGGSNGDPMGGDELVYGNGGSYDRGREFTFVNPRNINIPVFTCKSLNINPYLPFNNAIRRFILAQGADGELLLGELDKIEKMGGGRYIY